MNFQNVLVAMYALQLHSCRIETDNMHANINSTMLLHFLAALILGTTKSKPYTAEKENGLVSFSE